VQSSSMGKPSALVVLSSFIAVLLLRSGEGASARLVAVQTGQDVQIYGVDEKDSSIASILGYKVSIFVGLPVTIHVLPMSTGHTAGVCNKKGSFPHAYLHGRSVTDTDRTPH
jgi:hypothetical protein